MVLGDTDVGNHPSCNSSNDGARRHRCRNQTSHYSHCQRATKTKTWGTSSYKNAIQLECLGQYVELLNFEMEDLTILETKTYEITDEKIPSNQELVRWGGLATHKNIHK